MSRKLKKMASLVLAAAMLLSCFAFVGSAAGTATGDEAMNVGLALSAESAKAGDIITVKVNISNNYYATTMRFPILYSKAAFELVDGSLTAGIDSVTAVAGETTSTTNEEFIPASYSADDYSAFTIQWIAKADGVEIGAFNSATAVECFSFQLKVLEDASGTGSVLIPSDSDKFYKMAVSDKADATTYYSAPVAFTFSEVQNVTIEAAYTAPELVALGNTIIDEERGFIYGLPSDGTLTDDLVAGGQVEIVGEGRLVATYADGAEGFGTGAKIELVDSKNEVVETYYIVIFGDNDGNGYIDDIDMNDAADAFMFNECKYDYGDLTIPNVFAMDIYADGIVDDTDIAFIEDLCMFNIDSIAQDYQG